MKRGLFLDLDGTLADTLPLLRATYRLFLAEHGREGTDAEFREINGPPLDRVVEILKSKHGLEGPSEDLLWRYMALIRVGYLDVKPSEGAVELVRCALEKGWVCALVTSNSEDLAGEWLSRQGLAASMSVVVGKESVRLGKPDPEPYLIALALAGCSSEKSIAVEDSPAGFASARAANLRAFAYVPRSDASFAWPPGTEFSKTLVDLKARLE